MVKQCLECGMTIKDEGFVDTENLDFSEEPDPLLEKKKDELEKVWNNLKTTINFGNGIYSQLTYSTAADSGIYYDATTGGNNAYLTFDKMF